MKFLIIACLIILFALILAWPFIWLWNYAVVAALVFANPITEYWVGFWLMIFIGIFLVRSVD